MTEVKIMFADKEQTLSFEKLDLILGEQAPFLMSLSDGSQGELRLVISAAEVGEAGRNIPEFEEIDQAVQQTLCRILSASRPIKAKEHCLFEICFCDYIIYQIRNESFCSYDPEEIRQGKYLIVFERSKLLSHLDEITDAKQLGNDSFYPGKWAHYGIYTQNHVIDVISHCPPMISNLMK